MEQRKNKIMQNNLILLFAILILVICQMSVTPLSASASPRNKINLTKLVLTVGESWQLSISGLDASKVKWSSSKKAVATVNKKGTVTAKIEGSTVISARFFSKKLTCTVSVKKVFYKKGGYITTNKKSNILIAYFSWSGTSEGIARDIVKQSGADLFRIEREKAYSSDYETTAYGEAKTEADTNARPSIKKPLASISNYDKIIICYPIWWHTAPMTVGTFLESYDWTGKTIYPISQSASMDSSQYDESIEFIKKNAKNAVVDSGIFSANSKDIQNYVETIIK